LETVFAPAIAARWPGASSAKPKTQSGSVRCAVDASMTRTGMLGQVRRDLAHRGVGQAEDGDIGLSEGADARVRDFRSLLGQRDQRDVRTVLEARADLKTRRSNLAVDEHLRSHGSVPCMDDAPP
jgi:hypothetical protein